MLGGLPILIVEDEALLALELAMAVEEFDGRPLGPVPTTIQALAMIDNQAIGAAILDANLRDGDVTPVAIRLLARSIPFVIHTAVGLPAGLLRLHPDLPVIAKPATSQAVLAALLGQIASNPGARAD